MPPQATGFRYTPPSYLLKTREENRPWNSSKNNNHVDEDELEECAMRQEDRPVRRETKIDAHFQQRVRKKQNRYRNILKGEEDVVPLEASTNTLSTADSTSNSGNGSDDSFVVAMNAEVEAIAAVQMELEGEQPGLTMTMPPTTVAAATASQAREARKQRLSGGARPPAIDPTDPTAETARTLRAHRLRSSHKLTVEEVDLQTKLELRRLKDKKREQEEQEASAKAQEQASVAKAQQEQLEKLERERKRLEQERLALEQEQAKKRKDAAVKRAAMLRQQRSPKEREASSVDSLDELLQTNRASDKTSKRKPSTRRQRLQHLKSKNCRRPRKAAAQKGERDQPDEDEGDEFAFMDDLGALLRETGLFTGCVAQCFGEDTLFNDKTYVPSSEESASTGNPSVNDAIEKLNHRTKLDVYAKYRE